MHDLILRRFKGKSVVLLGFGREGQATYTLLRKVLPHMELFIADASDHVRSNPILAGDNNLQFITGEDYLSKLDGFDLIVRSPGIPVWQLTGEPKDHFHQPKIQRERITSQTELFLEKYSSQVIGVTGTKGKSTTSSLICHILRGAGKEVLLAGNIGNPVFHLADLIRQETIIVVELSSHQLEYLKVAPHIAVFLNLFQEHLDAYTNYEAYQQAKLNITRYQRGSDYLIYNGADLLVTGLVKPYLTARNGFSFSMEEEARKGTFIRGGQIFFSDGLSEVPVWKIHQDRFLRGEHNLKNIMAAINVAMILKIDTEFIEDGIATFKGLEHRLEYVGEFGKIHFYNDSIATIPEACMEALKAIPMVDTLVVGGFDRGIDYSVLGRFLATSAVRNIILVGAAGNRIGKEIRQVDLHRERLFFINRFDDFAAIAFRETRPGYTCVLSPAAASYDEFSNFEERGKRYRELIRLEAGHKRMQDD